MSNKNYTTKTIGIVKIICFVLVSQTFNLDGIGWCADVLTLVEPSVSLSRVRSYRSSTLSNNRWLTKQNTTNLDTEDPFCRPWAIWHETKMIQTRQRDLNNLHNFPMSGLGGSRPAVVPTRSDNPAECLQKWTRMKTFFSKSLHHPPVVEI